MSADSGNFPVQTRTKAMTRRHVIPGVSKAKGLFLAAPTFSFPKLRKVS